MMRLVAVAMLVAPGLLVFGMAQDQLPTLLKVGMVMWVMVAIGLVLYWPTKLEMRLQRDRSDLRTLLHVLPEAWETLMLHYEPRTDMDGKQRQTDGDRARIAELKELLP